MEMFFLKLSYLNTVDQKK